MTVDEAHTSLNMQAEAPWFIPNADKTIQINDNKTLTYDDILYGYDLILEKHRMFSMTHWMGMYFQQDPPDAMALHDLFWRLQIDLLIELGTDTGGSAIFYSSFMRMYNPNALVITIDPKHVNEGSWDKGNGIKLCPDCIDNGPNHFLWDEKYIHFIHGVPTDSNVIDEVEKLIELRGFKQILVMEDGCHARESVFRNINAYEKFVTVGSYLVVQDTKMDRWPGSSRFKHGPGAAIESFLDGKGKDRYVRDVQWEYLLISQHHGGFLKKIRD